MRVTIERGLLLTSLVLAGCSDDSDDYGSTTTNPSTGVDASIVGEDGATFTTTEDGAIARTIEIAAQSPLKFSPDRIVVKTGELVQIVLHNQALVEHNIEFELGNGVEVELPENLEDGETGSLQFVAPAVGSYEFYCPVDGHRAAGMTGTLNVQP